MQWSLPAQQQTKKEDKAIKQNERPRVLIVEDNKFVLPAMCNMIKNIECDVEVSYNGQEAVTQFREAIKERRCFDLILMDLQMPVMDGYDATKEIRDLEQKH